MEPSTRPTSAVRERMLDDAVRYVLDHGLIGFSLRPLAAAIGTSDRMVLYHFGSKENLIRCIVDRANEELTANVAGHPDAGASVADIVRVAWRYLSTEHGRKVSRLYIEICALSLQDRDHWSSMHRRIRGSWAGLLSAPAADVQSQSTRRDVQRLVVCAIDGLILDALMTGETDDVESALEELLTMLAPHVLSDDATGTAGPGEGGT